MILFLLPLIVDPIEYIKQKLVILGVKTKEDSYEPPYYF